jgi:hypothetical protein
MHYKLLLTISLVISTISYGYEAKIINHTPWLFNGRPTRAWTKMDDRDIKPYQEEMWDSGLALITGITLDLIITQNFKVPEILKESYVGRTIGVTYHIFAEPFLNKQHEIEKVKLILVREPAEGIGKAVYPGGIVAESKEIVLISNQSNAQPNKTVQKISTGKSITNQHVGAR